MGINMISQMRLKPLSIIKIDSSALNGHHKISEVELRIFQTHTNTQKDII